MSYGRINRETLVDIADAIRAKTGDTSTMTPSEMVTAINGIQTGDGAVNSVNGKTGTVVLDASDVGALPDDTVIPAAVTEQTVSGWGFTKNTGTYSKPSGGIPASDLADGVIPDISGKANTSDVYTKTEIDQKLSGAMDYKGTKATVSALPSSGNKNGDVWHITADGSEWAWNGSAWEELGTAVDLSGYATEQWVGQQGYLTQHQSLAAYRTASAQDTIDAAQDTAIADKQNSPYIFKVFYENGTYTVTTAPATVSEFFSIYQDRELRLEIYDIDLTRAKYYRGEVYPVQNSIGILFKDMQPNIDMQTYTITGAHSAGFGLAGVNQDNTITWQALDLGTLNLANASDIPTTTSELTNDSGFQTAAQVQSAIAAAAELPSGGTTGDFLRKTASGVAWQTIPSAESNSFGGGS